MRIEAKLWLETCSYDHREQMFVLEKLIDRYKINTINDLTDSDQKSLVNAVMRYKLLSMKHEGFHITENTDEELGKQFQNCIKRIMKFEALRGKLMKL